MSSGVGKNGNDSHEVTKDGIASPDDPNNVAAKSNK